MKLQLSKIVEVLSKIKNDEFYFKNYAPEIIESYADEKIEDYIKWCDENNHTGRYKWINNLSNGKKMFLFKSERSNLT